ncbi:hypothetical protein [Micromonospora kangleipakensis]|uniref:hypothetical protein n=1 Tax=Micromonospora kangleipakensis TaxID=1077942 RepID=UPI001028CE02|nr:hypothetical protein [Micromonospora kangleipakensis]
MNLPVRRAADPSLSSSGRESWNAKVPAGGASPAPDLVALNGTACTVSMTRGGAEREPSGQTLRS